LLAKAHAARLDDKKLAHGNFRGDHIMVSRTVVAFLYCALSFQHLGPCNGAMAGHLWQLDSVPGPLPVSRTVTGRGSGSQC
jgi:hypothetical protein